MGAAGHITATILCVQTPADGRRFNLNFIARPLFVFNIYIRKADRPLTRDTLNAP